MTLVERYFGAIPPGPPVPSIPGVASIPAHIGREVRQVVEQDLALARLFLAYRIPAYGMAGHPAAVVASSILTSGKSSMLYRTLVRERQLAQDVVSYAFPIVLGVSLLSWVTTRAGFVVSAMLFGAGFGSAYPIFVSHLMHHVPDNRRGATFGALIGAFDTGIGTGSIAIGWLGEHYGFSRAFGVAAAVATLSIPYFLFMEKRQWTTSALAPPA